MSLPVPKGEVRRLWVQNVKRVPVARENSRFNGYRWPDRIGWNDVDWRPGVYAKPFGWPRCFVDDGPSIMGNPGPYLKAPVYLDGAKHDGDYDTRNRIYPWWGHGGLPRRNPKITLRIEWDGEMWWWIFTRSPRTEERG